MTDDYDRTAARAPSPIAPSSARFAAVRSEAGAPASALRKQSPQAQRPSTEGDAGVGEATSGFTIIELLTVIAIIGILMSIAVTVGRGIQERAKIARAKAEMAVLAAALEQYKAHYGDYPWTLAPPLGTVGDTSKWDGGSVLFNAVAGVLRPTGDVVRDADGQPVLGRVFVELSKFELWSTDEALIPDPANPAPVVNWFNDPWGNWYYYHYRRGAPGSAAGDDWQSPGFLLYSHGPDGACNIGLPDQPGTPANTGLLRDFPGGTDSINADNLYYGRF